MSGRMWWTCTVATSVASPQVMLVVSVFTSVQRIPPQFNLTRAGIQAMWSMAKDKRKKWRRGNRCQHVCLERGIRRLLEDWMQLERVLKIIPGAENLQNPPHLMESPKLNNNRHLSGLQQHHPKEQLRLLYPRGPRWGHCPVLPPPPSRPPAASTVHTWSACLRWPSGSSWRGSGRTLCMSWMASGPWWRPSTPFPYPTSQETGALARQCALPVDDVKTWFMMQRVRYGISWAEEDIRETRHKLHTLRGEPEQSKEVEAASPGTVTPAVRPSEEEMMMTVDEDDQYDYYDEDDDGEEEEMMRAFGASEGMIAERKRQYLPAALWSAPPLTQLEPPPDAGSLQRTAAVELHHFPLHQPPLHQPPPPGVPSIGHLLACPPFVLTGQPLRMRSKKSRAQLMVLRRSFVISNWPSEGELQRLQGVTALSRHEIRKWFADSRYQLRRSGGEHKTPQRSSHAPGAAHEWKVAAPPDVLPRTSLGDGQPPGASGPGGEVEVVIKQEDHRDALRTFIRTKESHAKIASGVEAVPSLNGHSEASSASSAPTLSSYLLPGYPGGVPGLPVPERHQRLRKKTSEQTEVLRQAFLRCQWPTAEDYSRLEQLTGLPRTQIIHWFGDTRYSFKHARLRWIGPDERRDIATRLEMDASRAWQVRWHKQWPGLGTDGPPQPSPGNWMDASNSSTSSVQTLDGMAGGDFDRWYDLWDGAVQGQGGGAAGGGL
ncbi:hypothetical protein AALO_G00297260 [Alosa alosa]|uniref:Homeobox domain-containing protein n=1 Tax=Alosa alosa TaxID=278164 RepID=A0AAV6FDL8_9TELE|nr:hypothetical protein AALO_G00297260 [Alosa alosa]